MRVVERYLVASNKGSPLLVMQQDRRTTTTVSDKVAVKGFDDPEEGEEGEGEGRPVDEGVPLVSKDGEQPPGNGDAGSEITLRAGEGVCG